MQYSSRIQFPGDFPRNSTKTANKRSYLSKLVKKKPGFPKTLEVDLKFLKTVMADLHDYFLKILRYLHNELF